MSLEVFLERQANANPGKVALVTGQRRWTFAELEEASNQTAHALREGGVRRGDRVVVCLENCVETVLSIYGILKAGAVFVLVHPTTPAKKLTFLLNDCEATAFITRSGRTDFVSEFWRDVRNLRCVLWVGGIPEKHGETIRSQSFWSSERSTKPPPKRHLDADLAALIYTSGSTGQPKGVMLTHHNMVSAATSIIQYLENQASDIVLNVLPLSFDYGLYQVLMAFQYGGTVVLEPSFTYPHPVLKKIEKERVTGLPLVPTLAAMLLRLDLSAYDFSSLRYVTSTAAALPTEHVRALAQRFSPAKLYSMYGLTECKRVSYLPPAQLAIRPSSVGRGMPNQEIFLIDEDGHHVAPGGTGELVIRGSHVMKGYWNRPKETAERLIPGPVPGEKMLRSGDLFRQDEEGYLFFLGRKDDVLKCRGEKVSPREVEDALCAHPAVAEAAVLGTPDALLGQAVRAVVVLKPNTSANELELRRHCADSLEDTMRPKFIEIRDHLPRTPNGKIDKAKLAAEAVQYCALSG